MLISSTRTADPIGVDEAHGWVCSRFTVNLASRAQRTLGLARTVHQHYPTILGHGLPTSVNSRP